MPHESTVSYEHVSSAQNEHDDGLLRRASRASNSFNSSSDSPFGSNTGIDKANETSAAGESRFSSLTNANKTIFYGANEQPNNKESNLETVPEATSEVVDIRPPTPSELTHHEDFDDDDEDSDESKTSTSGTSPK
jgi:hypothetical protein